MSDSDQIMFGTKRSAERLAEQVAESLNVFLAASERELPYINRPSTTDPRHTLSANFDLNPVEDGILPGEESVMDGYAIELDIYLIPTGDEERQIESRRLFDDLANVIDVPMIYLRNYDHLKAVYQPGIGVTDLGDGVSPYAEAEPQWRQYIVDRDSAPE